MQVWIICNTYETKRCYKTESGITQVWPGPGYGRGGGVWPGPGGMAGAGGMAIKIHVSTMWDDKPIPDMNVHCWAPIVHIRIIVLS